MNLNHKTCKSKTDVIVIKSDSTLVQQGVPIQEMEINDKW